MFVSSRLQNIRCYTDTQLEYAPGVNIIIGPNGSGKTSVLESLFVACTGSTFRGGEMSLVRDGTDWARIDAGLDTDVQRSVLFKLAEDVLERSYVIDGVKRVRFVRQYGLPVVYFEPQHMNMPVGEPAGRRDFLDGVLGQTLPHYAEHLRQYKRVLAQRNALLKRHHQHGGGSADELFVWDLRLSELGGVLYEARSNLIEALLGDVQQAYAHIAGTSDKVEVRYMPSVKGADYTSALLSKLTSHRDTDLQRGFTSAGPHREDFELILAGRDAKISASRGETRSLLLALKIAELHHVEKALGTPPTLLLDDVFGELDGRRRRALAEGLASYQTFITTTDADLVVEHFAQAAHIIALG